MIVIRMTMRLRVHIEIRNADEFTSTYEDLTRESEVASMLFVYLSREKISRKSFDVSGLILEYLHRLHTYTCNAYVHGHLCVRARVCVCARLGLRVCACARVCLKVTALTNAAQSRFSSGCDRM